MPRSVKSEATISPRKWLLMPIETKARELMSKTLLACYAAKAGWGVVLGSKEVVRGQQTSLPKGVVLEKDADVTHENLPGFAHANGNRLCVMDEEGLVEYSRADYLKKRVSERYFRELDFFFAWGNVQAEWLETIERSADKVIRSGNPRFDLLRPEYRSLFELERQALNERYGRIILFNSNFGKFNTNMGVDFVSYLKEAGKLPDSQSEQFYRDATAFEARHMREFTSSIPRVAERFPGHTIIIRPHPSEAHEPWQELTAQHDNVHVLYEGSVHEWIMASDVVVHVNCTTGVEAYLLDKPAIAYRANKDPRFDFEVTYELSRQVHSDEELLSTLDTLLDGDLAHGRTENYNAGQVADRYISALDGELACERILRSLETLPLSRTAAGFPIRIRREPLPKRVAYQLGRVRRSLLGGESNEMNLAYTRKKFPGISAAEIQVALERITSVAPDFGDVRAAAVCKDTFCLYR